MIHAINAKANYRLVFEARNLSSNKNEDIRGKLVDHEMLTKKQVYPNKVKC